MLIGRAGERSRIERLLADARAGHSGTLVIRGEAGIGKTALLRYAVELADSMTVVGATGVESEAELEFSGLLELCRPLLAGLDAIPARHAEALRCALGFEPAELLDRFTVGAATLSLLAASAEERPLLVTVDDGHWLDGSSSDALLFAARRLHADRVALLVAERPAVDGRLHGALPTLELEGLDRDAALALLERSACPLESDVAHRLAAATVGNPLALLELPSLLSPRQLDGSEPLPDPLPVGAALEQAIARQIESLPDETQTALTVVAASVSAELAPVVAALVELGLPESALDPAEDARLLDVAETTVRFRHPLVRSVVHQIARSGDRRAAHRALADAHRGDAEHRAWHLAGAARGPDESAAAALEDASALARARSGFVEAATALERAAALSVTGEPRVRRLYGAANDWWLAGRFGAADRLASSAIGAGVAAPDLHGRLLQLRGEIAARAGDVLESYDLLVEGAGLVETADPAAAVEMLAAAVDAAGFAADPARALAAAERARGIAPGDGSLIDFLADCVLGQALCINGRATEADPHLERALRLADAIDDVSRLARYRIYGAIAAGWLDRLAPARATALAAIEIARAYGAVGVLPYTLEVAAWVEVRGGRWRSAAALAAEALELARETGQSTVVVYSLTHLGHVAAGRGEAAEVERCAEEALALAASRNVIAQWAEYPLALLDLGVGKLGDAVERLEGIERFVRERGYFDRDVAPGPDLVEALVRLDRREDAVHALERYRSFGVRASPAWGGALEARCRGLLAEDAEFEGPFREALDLHDELDDRFARARTELCFGERLRREGRRREARGQLRSALATFEGLGAEPWAKRTRAELRAGGERLGRRDPSVDDELTPQELRIALQVAEGKSNKEVAASMFLSPKTVEFHLGRVFRKLEVRSRTELARRMAAQGGAALTV